MTILPDPAYFSSLTLLGWVWSVVTFWLMFAPRGRTLLSNPWLIMPAAALLAGSLAFVMREMGMLSMIAGGLTPLDGLLGYGIDEVRAFASALGESGRADYARFQLGADALAPPAFACFLMAVYRSTIRSQKIQTLLTAITFIYFTSVLIANTFMPVIMQNYPEAEAGPLPLYYAIIPKLDLIKYSSHGLAWLIIFATWIWQILHRLRAAIQPVRQDQASL